MAANQAQEVSRRGFLAAVGAVTAALPVQSAFPWGSEKIGAGPAWSEAVAFHRPALRTAYLEEIARFAEPLRPRFEAGELRAHADGDGYTGNAPDDVIKAAVVAHFGLKVTETRSEDWIYYDGNEDVARLIMAASPHATASEAFGQAPHVCHLAADAALWDVIAHARARGWYTPVENEDPDPNLEMLTDAEMRAREVRS